MPPFPAETEPFNWSRFLESLPEPQPNYTQKNPCGLPSYPTRHISLAPPASVRVFCAYALLLIIVCGVVGNSLSLHVFTTSRSRSRATTSCSYCLIALSLCDLLVVLTYCLVEWTQRGLGVVIGQPGYDPKIVDYNGVCQVFLYIAYTLRLASVWLLVLFTLERYIGVCHPLQKRRLCTATRTKQAICGVIGVNALLCLYKPLLSNSDHKVCGFASDFPSTEDVSFILDSCYALSTSAVPFVVILCLNIGIARALLTRAPPTRSSGPDHMGIQFAAILITVSSTFILLNLPYSIVFLLKWLENRDRRASLLALSGAGNSSLDCLPSSSSSAAALGAVDGSDRTGWVNLATLLPITRTIFQANYCANFFLYSLTGAFFRAELRRLFCCGKQRGHVVSRQADAASSYTRRGVTVRSQMTSTKYMPASKLNETT